jgi:hypothetical protein
VRILRFLVSHLFLDLGPLCHQPTEASSICRATCTERSYLSAHERDQDTRKALRLRSPQSTRPDGPPFSAVVVGTQAHWSRHLQSPILEPIFFAPHNKKGSSQQSHERGGRRIGSTLWVWGFLVQYYSTRTRSTLDPKSDGPALPPLQQIASSLGSSRFSPVDYQPAKTNTSAWLSQKGRVNVCICSRPLAAVL